MTSRKTANVALARHRFGSSLPFPDAAMPQAATRGHWNSFGKLSRRAMRAEPVIASAARLSCDFASRKLAGWFAGLAKRCFAFNYCHWLLAQYLVDRI
jgi:hypothetical protein